MPLIPTKIKIAAGNDTMAVDWSDGHSSVYPYAFLRARCPCAMCTDKHAGPPKPESALPMFGAKRLKLQKAELVGRYALQLFWNDGHASGIYSFEYLRELCPCEECASRARTGAAGQAKV
jgi:DUF971 family protein